MAGYLISQNIECVKYNIDGNKACSIVLTRSGIIHSINIQVASYVNKKMFIFTMQATPYDFDNYLPVFQNMLTSFKAPATSVNTTTLTTKTATIVNQTTIQKTPAPLLNGAGRSSNLNRFHNRFPFARVVDESTHDSLLLKVSVTIRYLNSKYNQFCRKFESLLGNSLNPSVCNLT